MKTAFLPQVRVAKELRTDLESVLHEGETLSSFVETSVRSAVEYRRVQAQFHASGEAAWQQFRRDGVSLPASEVLDELHRMLAARRRQLASSTE